MIHKANKHPLTLLVLLVLLFVANSWKYFQMELHMNQKRGFRFSVVILYVLLGVYCCSCSKVEAPLGSKAALKCRVDGIPLDPSTMVVWEDPRGEILSYNTNPMKTGDPRFTIVKPYHTEFNLHISNIKMSDKGNYTCKALKNSAEFFSILVELNILVPPKARTPHNKNISVVEGGEVVLQCQGEGIPEPELDWRYHGRDSSVEEAIAMEDPTRYSIKNITLKQSGHYECQANNNVPPISSVHYFIEVLSAPKIHVPYLRVMQKVGSYIFLQCIIAWNPRGNFYWEHEGRRIFDDSHETKGRSTSDKYIHSMHKIDSHSWSAGLFVFHFDISDGGRYRCHGSNKYGTKHGTIEVAAYQAFDGADGPDMPQRIVASPGSDVILHCEGGNVKPSWSMHTVSMLDFETIPLTASGKTVGSSKYQLTEEQNLKIISVNKLDQGYYVCQGKSNRTIYLSVADVEASTSCAQNGVSLTVAVVIVAAVAFVLCLIFVVLLLVLKRRYQRRFNTSGESILTGTHSLVSHKV